MKTKLFLFLILSILMNGFQGCRTKKDSDSRSSEDSDHSPKISKDRVNRNVDVTKTNTYMVVYDFKTGVYDSNMLKVQIDRPVVYKIENINRFAYDIRITVKDSVLAGSVFFEEPVDPSILPKEKEEQKVSDIGAIATSNQQVSDIRSIGENDFDKKSITDKKVPFLKQQLKSISFLEEATFLLTKMKDTLRKIEDKLLDTKYKYTEDSLLLLNTMTIDTVTLTLENAKRKELITNLLAETNKLSNRIDQQNLILKDLNLIKEDAFKKFSSDNTKFIIAFDELKVVYNNAVDLLRYYKETYNIITNPELTSDIYTKNYRDRLQEILNRLPLIKEDVSKFQMRYSDVIGLYNAVTYNPAIDTILNYGGKIKLYAHVESMKSMADKMNEVVGEINADKMLRFMFQNIKQINEPSSFEFISNPVQPMKDVVVFDIDIKRKFSIENQLYVERKFKHREFTRGGVRFDMGVGLLGSLYPNVKRYTLGQIGDSAQIHIKSNQLYVPSIAALATISLRSAGYFTGGFSAGVGIDILGSEITMSNFYSGFSFIMGKYDRMMITGGLSIGHMNVLKPGYDIEKMHPYPNQNGIDDFLMKEYRAGFFVAITYNLTRGLKDNVKYLKSSLPL